MRDVILKTNRFIMKSPVGIINTDDVINAIKDDETLRYLCSAPYDYTEETAYAFLSFLEKVEESTSMLELGIFETIANRFIGMMSLENINYSENKCEIGYWIDKKFTGKGIAFEAAKSIIEYAFNFLNMKVIYAYVVTENIKSIFLLERLGFRQVELLRSNEENKGVLVDRYLYSLEVNIS